MKIPNEVLNLTTGNTMKVACKLYGIVNPSRVSKVGFEVCIKQSTLAKACGISVSTVKRAVAELVRKGFIKNRYRVANSDGRQGAYHYSLAFFRRYFFLRRDVFEYDLSAQEFKLYVTMCKLRSNGINSFFQSLNELEKLAKISKSDICKCNRSLVKKGLIARCKKRTKAGDFTDNTYFVVVRKRGVFKKRCPRIFRYSNNIIVAHENSFVNSFAKFFHGNKKSANERKRTAKIKPFCLTGGSGYFELSY